MWTPKLRNFAPCAAASKVVLPCLQGGARHEETVAHVVHDCPTAREVWPAIAKAWEAATTEPLDTSSQYTWGQKAFDPSRLGEAFLHTVTGGGHPSSRPKIRTFTPRNSHRIPDPQFVYVFGTTVRWFAPVFPVFDGPAPLTPALRGRRAVQIASEVE